MDGALLAARLVLVAVFLVAGLAKLAERSGSRAALRDFGLPAGLAAPLGGALPLAELAVAAALVPIASAWWGALGAMALLLLFIGGIGHSLARGRHPECHCFGQLHSEPVGGPTLARNGALLALAGFVAWQGRADPGADLVGWLGRLTSAQWLVLGGAALALALLIAQGWLIVRLLRRHGRLLLRLDALEAQVAQVATATPGPSEPALGLPVGAPAPDFRLLGLGGEVFALSEQLARVRSALLVFVDPGCGPCDALLPELGRWQRELPAALALLVISRGDAAPNRANAAAHNLGGMLLQRDREVAAAYEAHGTPSAVLVRGDGTIGSPVAAGADAIRVLVMRAVAELASNGHVEPLVATS